VTYSWQEVREADHGGKLAMAVLALVFWFRLSGGYFSRARPALVVHGCAARIVGCARNGGAKISHCLRKRGDS
jgi:hypothetical protein